MRSRGARASTAASMRSRSRQISASASDRSRPARPVHAWGTSTRIPGSWAARSIGSGEVETTRTAAAYRRCYIERVRWPVVLACAALAAPAARADDGATDDPALGKASRVNGNEMHGVVAFTFDDGPNPATTPAVIDALEKYDVPATFFIVTSRVAGKYGDKGREVLALEIADGFLVGDHSSTHPI